MAPPVSEKRLEEIAKEACDSALSSAPSYAHAQTPSWNDTIISRVLQTLVSETSSGDATAPPFKFLINSTIIQHTVPGGDDTGAAEKGRRGMHSAAGAYWNNEKDGMWSYKYEGGEKKGMDVVVLIAWVGI